MARWSGRAVALFTSLTQKGTTSRSTVADERRDLALRFAMELITVRIEKPDDINFILGQSHFIKTVEDIHEAMVQSVPGIKFGLAFCEASGLMLVRWTGTDNEMMELAKRNALSLAAGHSFILFLGPGFFPVNVLN